MTLAWASTVQEGGEQEHAAGSIAHGTCSVVLPVLQENVGPYFPYFNISDDTQFKVFSDHILAPVVTRWAMLISLPMPLTTDQEEWHAGSGARDFMLALIVTFHELLETTPFLPWLLQGCRGL